MKECNWRPKLDKFLATWEYREHIDAVIVGGSLIVGTGKANADLDVHIILKPTCTWRERGNMIVDGLLIEYFANAPAQIKKYFVEETNERRGTARMLTMGEVLIDNSGIGKALQQEARQILEQPFEKLQGTEFVKYALWDNADNLEDIFQEGHPYSFFTYHVLLEKLLSSYARFLEVELSSLTKLDRFFHDAEWREKYIMKPFPDSVFVELFDDALKEPTFAHFQTLTNHVLERMGGFQIDGWKQHGECK